MIQAARPTTTGHDRAKSGSSARYPDTSRATIAAATTTLAAIATRTAPGCVTAVTSATISYIDRQAIGLLEPMRP
jgi:hypothetical protein